MKVIILVLLFFVAVTQSVVPKNENFLDDRGRLILTPLIEDDKIEEAVAASEVKNDKFLGVKSYSGYFTVNKEYNSNLFLWYFPHATNKEASLMLYLQGGPGASTLYSLFEENGPLKFKKPGELEFREHAWSNNHSLIYIENPVGVGYSFTDSEDGYATNETQIGEEIFEALRQFFIMFPGERSNRFYISGESYAGHYVPAACYAIDKKNADLPTDQKINLKGFGLGSGWTDPINQIFYADYLYNIGLLDSDTRDDINAQESQVKLLLEAEKYEEAAYIHDRINSFRLVPYKSLVENITDIKNRYNYIIDKTDDDNYFAFVQEDDIRTAIHVGDTEYMESNNHVKMKLVKDIMRSMVPEVTELLNKGYKGLFYTGQVDFIVPYPGVSDYISKMENWNDLSEYKKAKRVIWYVGDDLAGYYKSAGTLTEVVIRNAGHMAPMDQPVRTLDMILRLTKD